MVDAADMVLDELPNMVMSSSFLTMPHDLVYAHILLCGKLLNHYALMAEQFEEYEICGRCRAIRGVE